MKVLMFPLLMLILPWGAFADMTGVNFTVNVTVIDTPCHVNGDKPVDVNFGDAIQTSLIDGKAYAAKPLAVSVTCDGNPTGSEQFSFQGTPSAFDRSALKTDVSGLAIRILKPDNTALTPGDWQDIKKDQTITLTVVPEKDSSVTLSGGKFTASGTLILQVK